MAELSKTELFLNELSNLESMASILTHKLNEAFEQNKELEKVVVQLKEENQNLRERFMDLEEELEHVSSVKDSNLLSTLSFEERENLKVKIKDLITRLDFHISS